MNLRLWAFDSPRPPVGFPFPLSRFAREGQGEGKRSAARMSLSPHLIPHLAAASLRRPRREKDGKTMYEVVEVK